MDLMKRSTPPQVAPPAAKARADRRSRITRRVESAERAVEALGEAISGLDETPSPQMARSVQATVNLIRGVEQKYGLLSASEAGAAVGSTSTASRNLAARRHASGELLAITTLRGGRRYPGFQFLPDQGASPAIKTLRTLADEHNWSEYDLFLWLVTPRGRLDGAVPADLLDSSDGQERVTAAAALDMQTDW